MKDDCTTNSHYLTYTFLFRKVVRMYFLNLGVKGLSTRIFSYYLLLVVAARLVMVGIIFGHRIFSNFVVLCLLWSLAPSSLLVDFVRCAVDMQVTDASLLTITGFPAFAIDHEGLRQKTRDMVTKKLEVML